jgi:hypothetical protein
VFRHGLLYAAVPANRSRADRRRGGSAAGTAPVAFAPSDSGLTSIYRRFSHYERAAI